MWRARPLSRHFSQRQVTPQAARSQQPIGAAAVPVSFSTKEHYISGIEPPLLQNPPPPPLPPLPTSEII